MKKVSLEKRIERFIFNYSDAEYIPLHPEDFNKLKFEGRLESFSKPVKKLGEISITDQ